MTRRTSRSTESGATSTRAIDQYGQLIDVLLSTRRDADAPRRFFGRALRMHKVLPTEVVTDAAPVYPGVVDPLGLAPRGAVREQPHRS